MLCYLTAVVYCITITFAISPSILLSEFTGKIQLSAEKAGQIDLSAVEIKVYKATQRQQTVPNVLEYDETYQFSVFPDAQGNFSFERPSAAFSITLDIDSLPAGYGLKKHTAFYQGEDINDVFELCEIENVNLYVSAIDTTPEVTFTNIEGTEVYTGYNFEPEYFYDENNESLIISGEARMSGGTTCNLTKTFDLCEGDPVYNIEQLRNLGLITEEERLNQLVDLLNGTIPIMNSGTAILDMLAEYRESSAYDSVQQDLKNKIDQVFKKDEISTLSINAGTNESNSYFTVYYDTDEISLDVAKDTLTFLNQLRSYALSAGFELPIPESGHLTYRVFLSEESNEANGYTYPVDIDGGKAGSYIEIYNFNDLSVEDKETIAHEYFHAIQNAYHYYNSWFKEASAVWFAAKYSGSISRAKSHFNTYFSNSQKSINDATIQYGAGIFPMAIYTAYGGADTIVKIYEELASYSSSVSDTILRGCITNAIQEYDSTGSFANAYKKVGAYISYPGHFYSNTIPSGVTWENNKYTFYTATSATTKSATLNPSGCKLFGYSSDSSEIKQLSITVDFGAAKSTNSVRVVLKSSTSITPIGGDVSGTRYSTIITDFGNSATSKVTVAPINAASSGSITANVSVS